MAKSTFNLDDFKSSIRQGSLARTNRFEVNILKPPRLASDDERLVSLYSEQTSLPPINLNVRSYKIWGPTIHRPQSIEYGGEGISITFHVDRDMRVKKFFDDWLDIIVSGDNYTVSYQEDYATTVDIHQLNEQNDITYTAQLVNAFPRSMNLMELNNASQNQTHRLVVTFAYEYWLSPRSSQPFQAPQAFTDPQVPRDLPAQLKNTPYNDFVQGAGNNPFAGGGGGFAGAGAEGSF